MAESTPSAFNSARANDPEFQRQALLACVSGFAASVVRYSESMLATPSERAEAALLEQGISSSDKVIVSILFTGTVYGEYVLALDYPVALQILRNQGASEFQSSEVERFRQEIGDLLTEFLNLTAGEAVAELSKYFEKITITAPRVFFGRMSYPRIRTAAVSVAAAGGTIDCFLYIDRMRLDIATSYKSALDSLSIAHEELKAAMDQLKVQQELMVRSEKMAALGVMASGVAHEINTPLAVVSMSSEMIRDLSGDEKIDRAHLVESLDTIDRTITKISKVTKAMWALAHGLKGSKCTTVPVGKLIDDALLFCAIQLKEQKIELRLPVIEASAVSCEIDCRAQEVSQAILNLILNAKDAVEKESTRWIEIVVNNLPETVEIMVTDSGTGIPVELRGKIFDPFYTTKEIGKGAGLGLCLVKGIVDEHHGRVDLVADAPNTTFKITLPKRGSVLIEDVDPAAA